MTIIPSQVGWFTAIGFMLNRICELFINWVQNMHLNHDFFILTLALMVLNWICFQTKLDNVISPLQDFLLFLSLTSMTKHFFSGILKESLTWYLQLIIFISFDDQENFAPTFSESYYSIPFFTYLSYFLTRLRLPVTFSISSTPLLKKGDNWKVL